MFPIHPIHPNHPCIQFIQFIQFIQIIHTSNSSNSFFPNITRSRFDTSPEGFFPREAYGLTREMLSWLGRRKVSGSGFYVSRGKKPDWTNVSRGTPKSDNLLRLPRASTKLYQHLPSIKIKPFSHLPRYQNHTISTSPEWQNHIISTSPESSKPYHLQSMETISIDALPKSGSLA